MDTMTAIFGEVISSYSRAQALEDGELVDVSETGREAGFKFPVAITRGLYALLEPTEKDKAKGQDFAGRLWDVLYMLSMAVRGERGGDTIRYKIVLVVNGRRRMQTLKSVCGPGDDAEPVITVMLPEED